MPIYSFKFAHDAIIIPLKGRCAGTVLMSLIFFSEQYIILHCTATYTITVYLVK